MNNNFMMIFRGVCIVIVASVFIWICSTARSNETDIAVIKSQYIGIQATLEEVKEILKNVRDDQINRKTYGGN